MRLKGHHPVSQQLSAVLPEPRSNPAVNVPQASSETSYSTARNYSVHFGRVPRAGQEPNTTIRKPNHSQGDM